MGSHHAHTIAIIGKRPGFDDRPGAVGIEFGDAGGTVLGVVRVSVYNSVLDAAGHVSVEVILVGVRHSTFDGNGCHSVRNQRAIAVCGGGPARWIGRLWVVHARIG